MVWTAAGPATARPLQGLTGCTNLRGRGKDKLHPKPKYTPEELQTLAQWREAPRDLWGYPSQIPQHPPENPDIRSRHSPLSGIIYCRKPSPENAWWRFTKPRDQARFDPEGYTKADPEYWWGRTGWGREMRLCDEIDERRNDQTPAKPNPKPHFNPPTLLYIKPRPVTEGDKLIAAHFHVAWWAAWLYNRHDFHDAPDRFQEACIALCRQQRAFNPNLGVPFQDSAWIPARNAVLDYLKKQRQQRRGDGAAEEFYERKEEYSWLTLAAEVFRTKDAKPQPVRRRVRHRIKRFESRRKTKNETSTTGERININGEPARR
jgi:DNA-directed RNA polymerase specialized sigma24 family protein